MQIVFLLEELDNLIDWNKPIIIIGSGKDNTKYYYDPRYSNVFAINSAIQQYTSAHFGVIVEDHYKQLFHRHYYKNKRIILITKSSMRKHSLVIGCSVTIFVSYLIKNPKFNGKSIYFQGFSMDAKQGYDWNRQVGAFTKLNQLAKTKGINLYFSTYNSRISFIPKMEPPPEVTGFYSMPNGISIPISQNLNEMDLKILKLLYDKDKNYTIEQIESIIRNEFTK